MPKVAVKLMAFHAFPSEREIPLFVKDLTITCETWAEVDLMVAEMVAYPILVAGSALFPDGEGMAKLHRCFHIRFRRRSASGARIQRIRWPSSSRG